MAEWWQGLRLELDVDRVTIGDLVEAARLGVLADVMAMAGVADAQAQGAALTEERLGAVAFMVLIAARQQRPETTMADVHQMPWSALVAMSEG